jgi:hypothetical protein
MYCLAILDSGNYVLSLCRAMEKKGYIFEVVSTPCAIARSGCGYCLKFPEEYSSILIEEGMANKCIIREIYRVIPEFSKNRYVKIY